jgi:hypothetical protein
MVCLSLAGARRRRCLTPLLGVTVLGALVSLTACAGLPPALVTSDGLIATAGASAPPTAVVLTATPVPTRTPAPSPTPTPIPVGFSPGANDSTITRDAAFLWLGRREVVGGVAYCFIIVPYTESGQAKQSYVWASCDRLHIDPDASSVGRMFPPGARPPA